MVSPVVQGNFWQIFWSGLPWTYGEDTVCSSQVFAERCPDILVFHCLLSVHFPVFFERLSNCPFLRTWSLRMFWWVAGCCPNLFFRLCVGIGAWCRQFYRHRPGSLSFSMLCLAPVETSNQIFAGLLSARVNLTLPGHPQLDLKPGGAQGQDESCISCLPF